MVTQETQPDTPEASARERPRSRKHVGFIAGGAVVVILAAIGVYLMGFRPLPTTVSWAPSASVILPGRDLTVSGQITPAESGRHLLVQSASNANGPWQRIPQAATTDSHGRFAITFKPQVSGPILMRVLVNPSGRYLEVASQAKPVRILSLSRISLTGGGRIPTQTPIGFAVSVEPPSAGRTVRIEQSSDKVRWVPVGPSGQTKADGTAVVNVPPTAVGAWYYHAKVAQDDKYAAALSALVGAKVVDLKAEAAKAAAAKAAADAEAAKKAVSTRPAPQYGYQCMPGDEKYYSVCAGNKAWIDGQIEYDNCINSGRTWDIATQKCR